MVAGAFLISTKNQTKRRFKISKALGLVLIAVLFFAARSLLLNYITLKASFFQVIFYTSLGSLIVALLLVFFKHPHIKRKLELKGIKHLMISNLVSVIGLAFYMIAISLKEVSLVSAFGSVQDLFVFIFATLLTKIKPTIVKEKITRKILMLKLLAIALIIAGSVLIV